MMNSGCGFDIYVIQKDGQAVSLPGFYCISKTPGNAGGSKKL